MVRRALLAACLLALLAPAGCDGPVAWFPGGRLGGPLAPPPAGGWPLADGVFRIALETRPEDPYSVHVNGTVRGGRIYIDPAPERTWARHLAAEPRARVRLYDPPAAGLYEVIAVRVAAAEERSGFEPDREVYRLDPRGTVRP